MTGKLTEDDVEKLFKYLAEFISEHPERANEIMEFAQTVKPLIQNQMTTADIYNEIAVENLDLKDMKKRAEQKLEVLKKNLNCCSNGSRSGEIIESNIRVCESILSG